MVRLVIDAREFREAEAHGRGLRSGAAEETAAEHAGAGRGGHAEEGAAAERRAAMMSWMAGRWWGEDGRRWVRWSDREPHGRSSRSPVFMMAIDWARLPAMHAGAPTAD
jgi:hypothetical protein